MSNWLTEKAQLEKAKKDTETVLATEKKKKLAEDLVTKLDGMGLPEEKLTELKSLLTDIKDQKANQIDYKKLSEEINKQPKEINYWSIGACIFAGLIATVSLVFKSKQKEA